MLLYEREMGRFEKSILDQCTRFGTPLPDRIANKPRLFTGLQFLLESFYELDTERHHGNGLMSIPWSSIARYAKFHGFGYDDTVEFAYLIRELDSAIIALMASEQRSKMGK